MRSNKNIRDHSDTQASDALTIKPGDLAHASHELRTPLSALLMAIELLQGTDLDENQQNLVSTAVEATRDLARLVDELVNTTRVGHLSGKPELQSVDLYGLISSALNSMSALSRENAVGLEFWFDPKLPQYIRTDAGRVRQIIVNLVGNAIKHVDHGTVSIRASYGEHTDGGGGVRLEISDSGPGIEQAILRRLFEPSSQGDDDSIVSLNPDTRNQKSAGLGLSITRALARQLHGDIRVQSTVGVGTTIRVLLPLNAEPAQPGAASLHPAVTSLSGQGRVLLVDDDRLSRIMLAAMLEKSGYHIVQAEDGEQALQAFCSQPFDLVISDMNMPGMSGTEMAAKMRIIEQLSDSGPIPMIALTGVVGDHIAMRLAQQGFNKTLSKPIPIDSLLHAVSKMLGNVDTPQSQPH
ncbi:MAG: ATP-binding protein [Burkholderiaceae bacterium]